MDDAAPGPTPAAEEPESEVPLCLSCSAPRGPRDDFCARCGAPGSTLATAGAFETIRSWAWALEASGRWAWTRRAALLSGWAVAGVELVLVGWFVTLDWPPRDLVEWMWVTYMGAWAALLVLLLRYVTRRWWRPPPNPEIREPGEADPAGEPSAGDAS